MQNQLAGSMEMTSLKRISNEVIACANSLPDFTDNQVAVIREIGKAMPWLSLSIVAYLLTKNRYGLTVSDKMIGPFPCAESQN